MQLAFQIRIMADGLQQVFELLNGQSSITHNSSHGEGIDWIMPRNNQDADAIRQDGVFSLTKNIELSFF
jgi:hypothetical protein